MKVKCPACNTKMSPHGFGDLKTKLRCLECGMKAEVSFFNCTDQEILDTYIEGQSENLQDSQDVVLDFLSKNPLSPAFNVANYIMTRLVIKPDLTHIDDDLIRMSHRSPRNTFRIALNLDEGSVIYSFVDKVGQSIINPLPSGRNGLAYCDFSTILGLNNVCRDLDKVSAEFVVTETGGGGFKMNVGKWLEGYKCYTSFGTGFSQDLIIIAEGYDWVVCKSNSLSYPVFCFFSSESEKNESIKEWELQN